jgi:hypothetical protein
LARSSPRLPAGAPPRQSPRTTRRRSGCGSDHRIHNHCGWRQLRVTYTYVNRGTAPLGRPGIVCSAPRAARRRRGCDESTAGVVSVGQPPDAKLRRVVVDGSMGAVANALWAARTYQLRCACHKPAGKLVRIAACVLSASRASRQCGAAWAPTAGKCRTRTAYGGRSVLAQRDS